MSKVTQADIAKALGLSPTTVGLVVGAVDSPLRKRLSEETIRRVQDKAKEMGYLPNRAAQIVRRGRSNLILLLSLSGHSELGARSANRIGRLVHEEGFEFQTVDAYWWPGDGRRFIDQVLALRPEGVIITGSSQTEINLGGCLLEAGIRVVGIGYEATGAPHIRYDAHQAMRELTLATIADGRESPALFLQSHSWSWNGHERLRGFLTALDEAGWQPPTEYKFNEPIPEPRPRHASIFYWEGQSRPLEPFSPGATVAPWIKGYADALICSNDYFAFGAMSHFLQRGVSIPDELTVSGFDNLSFSSQGITPLTTVEQPLDEMCQEAMNLLMRWIGGKKPGPVESTFPCKIIWRQSMPQPEMASVES